MQIINWFKSQQINYKLKPSITVPLLMVFIHLMTQIEVTESLVTLSFKFLPRRT